VAAQRVHLGRDTVPRKPGIEPIHKRGGTGPKVGDVTVCYGVGPVQGRQQHLPLGADAPPRGRAGPWGVSVHQISDEHEFATDAVALAPLKRATKVGGRGHARVSS